MKKVELKVSLEQEMLYLFVKGLQLKEEKIKEHRDTLEFYKLLKKIWLINALIHKLKRYQINLWIK